MVYVGIYALIYLHTILGEGIVSRDGLPRGVLPSGILKIEKYCPGLKVPISSPRAIPLDWPTLLSEYYFQVIHQTRVQEERGTNELIEINYARVG